LVWGIAGLDCYGVGMGIWEREWWWWEEGDGPGE
jgi:hypothetical protein